VDPPLAAVPIGGGKSNLTYCVEDGAGRRFVLRRPPHGPLMSTAHDVHREARIIHALRMTLVPVPPIVGILENAEVAGAPGYVMQFVEGRVLLTDGDGAAYPAARRAVLSADIAAVLALIHAIDVEHIGLGSLSRRQDFLTRQLRRWQAQALRSARVPDPLGGQIHDRLVSAAPPQRYTGLVHGDYRPGNVIVSDHGAITAVLDWELATLGDVLADIGWLVATWRQPGEPEIFESPTAHTGYLTRDEVVALYARQTGYDLSDLGYYVAFAHWRLACIFQGIHHRRARVGASAAELAAHAEQVVTSLRAADVTLREGL
jgi:aminoglycoside phosphotransferase (APT) family kinase protein